MATHSEGNGSVLEDCTDLDGGPPRAHARALARHHRAVAAGLVAAAVGATLAWVVQPVRVSSDSMTPTLTSGEHVLLLKQPWAGPVARGDVVVLDGTSWAQAAAAAVAAGGADGLSPDRVDAAVRTVRGTSLVKRVVGVAGDTVELDDGALVVNGRLVVEPFVDLESVDGVWFGPVTVPTDAVFVMGDARASSIDSRDLGVARLDAVEGRVVSPLRR
ncbi:signal peptidase I [Terrabacter terrigena]|uniref:Signal peptidase I n=1 Tax=Terrabacter terrigena TaxID=574718 RepID=A0ABW3MS89_9MICO